jgi:hypothetical protein
MAQARISSKQQGSQADPLQNETPKQFFPQILS